jgi:hypothetical protein
MAMTRMRKLHQQLWGRAYLASSLLEACGSTGPLFFIQKVVKAGHDIFCRSAKASPSYAIHGLAQHRFYWTIFGVPGFLIRQIL